jgi:hypothetical protein
VAAEIKVHVAKAVDQAAIVDRGGKVKAAARAATGPAAVIVAAGIEIAATAAAIVDASVGSTAHRRSTSTS